jgi:predicted ATPase/DNA-binding SARP family transcriptional activator
VYVSTLRKALTDAGMKGDTLVRDGSGYRLALPVEALDHVRFALLLSEGQRLLAETDAAAGSSALRDALELWRGPALGDLADDAAVSGDAQRLEELRLVCVEERIDADLALGGHAKLVAELEQLTAQHPLRERLRGQLMLALYRSGRQSEALEVYQVGRRILVEELGLDPGSDMQALHSQILNHDPTLAAPARQSQPVPGVFKLPAPVTSFVGRERELSDVVSHLIDRKSRLLTLTGPGGAGKTRLGLESVAAAAATYPDGVVWVSLAPLRDPSLVLETIGHSVDADGGLAESIGERDMLIVLDNFEQVVESAPQLSYLLASCPNLSLLVTSRELLRVRGETEYVVSALEPSDGVALFCQRSQLAPSEEIAELCVRLDNLPLAVELAAARTKALSVSQILARLSSRLDFLTGGRDADPRQQTLRSTIEWSYELLPEEEQRVFRALSVFAAGCTLEAAETICRADIDSLQSLAEKSLLRFSQGRYLMLETIRAYAGDLLSNDERFDVCERHLDYYAAETYMRRKAARERDPSAWAFLDAEQADVLAALNFAVSTEATERAQQVLAGVYFHWLMRGLAGVGAELAARIVEMPSEPTALHARSLSLAGEFLRIRGEAKPAISLKERSLAVLGTVGELDVEAREHLGSLHADLSASYSVLGDLDAASRHAESALATRRALGDPRGVSHALFAVASVAARRGNLDEAARLYRESIALQDAAGAEWEAAADLGALALVLRRSGDVVGAREAADESMRRAVESGDFYGIAYGHATLGLLEFDAGSLEVAEVLLSQAVEEMSRLAVAFDDEDAVDVRAALEQCRRERTNAATGKAGGSPSPTSATS